VCLPATEGVAQVTLAHARLRARGGEAGNGAVCVVPVTYEGVMAGAVSFERFAAGATLTAEVRAQWEHVVALCGALLALKVRAHESWFARARGAWRAWRRRLLMPGDPAFRWWWGGVALAVCVAFFVPFPYSVGAPARLEGAVQRALAAATDGFLQQTAVRPGDRVKEGQVLAELAQQDLQLERSRRESEFSQHAGAYSAAFARADRTALMLSQARMGEARAQLDLVEKQLARTQIRAPFDGVVISGDLTQMLGAPVQRGTVLMTLVPHGRFRLIVEVDERDVRDVKTGAAGRVALAAMPHAPVAFRVERVIPIAATREGRHYFEAEGRLEQPDGAIGAADAGLRPGLQGVARISAEPRPLAAMLAGRFLNWLRLQLWSWGWLG
jgi:multidrug efflux pump subunit AcrA (membrane-fusion protein)